MNEKEAINVLVQAALIGQKSGVYALKDAALIYQAICVLNPDFAKEENEETKNEK